MSLYFYLFFKQLPFTVEDTLWCRNQISIEPAYRLDSLEWASTTGGQREAEPRTGSDVTIGPEGRGG